MGSHAFDSLQSEQVQAFMKNRGSELAHDNTAHVDRCDGTGALVLLNTMACLVELVEDAGQLVNVLADRVKEEIVECFEQDFRVLENTFDEFPFLWMVQFDFIVGDKFL